MAVGYGSVGGSNSQYTVGQQKVMAMRAARVDAFRALAEQVYGFRISGATSVSAFATHNDNMRTYVDAFVRGAQVVSMTAVSDGNFEATVELEMTPEFFSCMSNVYTCSYITTVQHDPYCSYSGCVQPNSYYYRNY
ncbi:MAG: LPP20 family lipoprotein [Rhodoferax sp.]|nr:LPP20 family lipoprotein [Rhodoferax sp.]